MTMATDGEMVDQLIRDAIRDGRWAAPLGWWGQEKGSLEAVVATDLRRLRDGTTPDELLAFCVDGAEDDELASWSEYVDDLVDALEQQRHPSLSVVRS